MNNTREQFNQMLKDLLMGPFPIPEFCQSNGQEILVKDPPQDTYVTGILFPQDLQNEMIPKK